MSSGLFTTSFYEASYGDGDQVHPIKVQPETLTATVGIIANESTATATTSPISALVSRSRVARGLNARIIYLQVTGTPPTNYAPGSRTKIPVMTAEFYAEAIAPGAEITYLATTWKVIGSSVEKVK